MSADVHRRHRLRNVSGGAFGALFLFDLGLTIVKGTKIVGGNTTLSVLWAACGTAGVLWLVTTDFAVERQPLRWVGFRHTRRPQAPTQALSIFAPRWLAGNRKMGANVLISDGKQLLAQWPPAPKGNELVHALAMAQPSVNPTWDLKLVFRWEQNVVVFLQSRAPEFTARFTTGEVPDHLTHQGMRDFMEKRIAELTAIHSEL